MSDLQKQIRRNRIAEVYILLCEAADKAAAPGPESANTTVKQKLAKRRGQGAKDGQ